MDLYSRLRKKVMRQLRAMQLFKPSKVSLAYMFEQEELRKWRRQALSLIAVQFVDGNLDAYKVPRIGWIEAKKSKYDYTVYITHIVMKDQYIVALVDSRGALYVSNAARGAKIIKKNS